VLALPMLFLVPSIMTEHWRRPASPIACPDQALAGAMGGAAVLSITLVPVLMPAAKLAIVVPITLVIIFVLFYLNFGRLTETANGRNRRECVGRTPAPCNGGITASARSPPNFHHERGC